MSFRDADPSETRKSMQATRFQVSERNQSSDDEGDESQDLLDGQMDNNQDTKIYKSFRHFTREALPRLDNYRNILSIQAQNRPTLDELHNATLSQKVSQVTEFILQMGVTRQIVNRVLCWTTRCVNKLIMLLHVDRSGERQGSVDHLVMVWDVEDYYYALTGAIKQTHSNNYAKLV